jgi:uncharacterized protein (DUF2141 family)
LWAQPWEGFGKLRPCITANDRETPNQTINFPRRHQMKKSLQTTLLAIIAAAAFGLHAQTVNAADLTVELKGVGDKGNVMVALYKKGDKWLGKSTAGTMVVAKKEGVSVTFKDLAEGEYAISMFVDENSNGKMDTNAIGIPSEPYGFSNDASGNFGPPSFEQAKVAVGKDNKTITITLK